MAHATDYADLHLQRLRDVRSLPPIATLALRLTVLLAEWERRRRGSAALSHLAPRDQGDLGIRRTGAEWTARPITWWP